MKKYIGTKQVMAAPMTYGQAHKEGLIRENAYVEEYDESPGYLVEYADGYKSWSPADVFESVYKVAETTIDRLDIEAGMLMKNIVEFGTTIYSNENRDKFKSFSIGERALMLVQLYAMKLYHDILTVRQAAMGLDANKIVLQSMSFEQVLALIREGYAVRREVWGENGKMVFKQVPAHITADTIPTMQSLPDEAKRLVLAAGDHIDYVSQCLIFDPGSSTANSWSPSVDDLFANDWQLVF